MDQNVNDHETRRWVDGLLAELTPPAGWRPDAGQAFERLQRKTRRASRRRRLWMGTLASVSAACIVLLMLPSTRSISPQAWEGGANLEARLLAGSEADRAAASFDGGNRLLLPERYREWVRVGGGREHGHGGRDSVPGDEGRQVFRHVYIDPSAYDAYLRTAGFPEGAVVVREVAHADDSGVPGKPVALEVVVKDGRFDHGWGFFDFTDGAGPLQARAQAQSDDQCWSCHHGRAQTNPVFTEYYPSLSAVF